MTTSTIRICAEWPAEHDRPVYTLEERCPACDGPAVQSAPARFSPEDPYGEYRRRAKQRRTDG